MLALLAAFAAAAVLLPFLSRVLGRSVFLAAAVVPAVAFGVLVAYGPAVLGGDVPLESLPWVPALDLALVVRLDPLSWLLALVVTGVGALVLVYCARYFQPDSPDLGRFAATFTAFAGAMLGLVIADDVYLLFVFWEATSIFSFLLIGTKTGSRTSRGAALQALLVTTLGGLVMLVGLVLLSVHTGTSRLSEIVELAPTGTLPTVAVLLVLVGALSKSAIVPFHFWLPGAMAAPTPVSAYLHAAAMVKAGIYLIARLAPGFAHSPGWAETLIPLGVITMLLGGVVALRQTDLKLLLAYGTVSQLGFLVIVLATGTPNALLAGVALLLAHAMFKATLFLVVGIIDHDAGTRDLRKLSGLGRAAPALAVVATLAAASMAGIMPLAGFVSKEAVLTGLLESATSPLGWLAIVGVAVGSVLTVAYGARFLWGAFGTRPGADAVRPHRTDVAFLTAPAALAVAGLAFGVAAPLLDALVQPVITGLPAEEEPYHLALWHGFEPALFLSLGTIVLGVGLFAWLGRRTAATDPGRITAANTYALVMRGIDRVASRVTSLTQRGSLPFYLAVILTVFVAAVGVTVLLNRSWPDGMRWFDYPAQLVIAAVMIVAGLAAVRAGKRFQAVVLVGVTGFGMSTLFALQGAPDLALTQILVEIVTLVAFVLVLRRLPARLGEAHGTHHRALRAVIAAASGVLIAVVAVIALGARVDAPISLEWPELAYEQGHGRNVVNVALVDLRGWDTMGELSVLIAAATGVASLLYISGRVDDLPRVSRRVARQTIKERRAAAAENTRRRASWLIAGRTLAPRNRSILLEVVVRLIFHALLVLSVYLLLVGHNAPGGGFAGGLVAGMALVARYLAGGREELGAAAPIDAGKLLGAGLMLAAGTALVPLFIGVDALTSTWFTIDLGVIGSLDFVTSTVFDIGVYLVVVGLALDVLRSLGAKVDEDEEEDAQQREAAT
ncbi:MAG TPA: Na+/H+ antiporter subunit A [Rhodoglobus sp.]|nr:Na+/H+ antiporter subunit A [Rhodoglobus sp.]